MAIYRCEAKIIGRTAKDKNGKPLSGKQVSVVAKAAYRSGERLRDERQEKIFNYRARSQEIVHTEILAPDHAPDWMLDRERLWNAVEKVERRKDSQLAREFIIALPVELSEQQQIEAIREWCQAEIVSKGYIADFALHRSRAKGGTNPHAHILTTLRPIEGENFGKKPDTAGQWHGRGVAGKGAKSELEVWRASWERHCNAALEKAGREERVDHRSLKEQGIRDRVPQPKIGVSAAAMERKGIATERARLLRWAKMDNFLIATRRSLQSKIRQVRSGTVWWQRAQVAMRSSKEQMVELLRDESSGGRNIARGPQEQGQESPSPSYWQDYVRGRQPDRSQEPDIEPGR